jgi:hypothetical protein
MPGAEIEAPKAMLSEGKTWPEVEASRIRLNPEGISPRAGDQGLALGMESAKAVAFSKIRSLTTKVAPRRERWAAAADPTEPAQMTPTVWPSRRLPYMWTRAWAKPRPVA